MNGFSTHQFVGFNNRLPVLWQQAVQKLLKILTEILNIEFTTFHCSKNKAEKVKQHCFDRFLSIRRDMLHVLESVIKIIESELHIHFPDELYWKAPNSRSP